MSHQSSNLQFSPLIIGTMRLGQWGAQMNTKAYESFIEQCLDIGISDFDHADIYGSYTTEAEFGEVLRSRPALRQKMQITTKCGIKLVSENRPDYRLKSYDSSAKHIIQSAEQSLRNFQTDYIDLFLIHRPDFLMNPQEIAEAVDQLKQSGKIRYFGVSNFTPGQMKLLSKYVHIDNHQYEFSVTHLDPFNDDTINFCYESGIKSTAWSPLAAGALFKDNIKQEHHALKELCISLCKKYNCSLDVLLIAWIRKHPSRITPILGSTKILRIASVLEGLETEISKEDWYAIYQASTGQEIA